MHNVYQNYLEHEVLTADPLKLVILLYRGAVDSVGAARRHLASRDIRARSRSITKALGIVAELSQSLNRSQSGDFGSELAKLYDYIQRLLIEANVKQTDGPLAETEKLLTTLLDAWQQCYESEEAAASAAVDRNEHYMDTYEPVSYAC